MCLTWKANREKQASKLRPCLSISLWLWLRATIPEEPELEKTQNEASKHTLRPRLKGFS
jgi:hypothetical protein